METIYEFIKETNKKSLSGKKLNLYKCKICNNYFLKRKSHIKNIKNCYHNHNHHNANNLSNTRLYKIYLSMLSRCNNTNNKDYKFYGLKGIKVCDEWVNNFTLFYNWAINNGYQDNLTIDRIDENINYEPNNCRWIKSSENSRFKSTTNKIEVNNIIKSGNQWAKDLNKSKNFINNMLKNKGLNYTKNYIKQNL